MRRSSHTGGGGSAGVSDVRAISGALAGVGTADSALDPQALPSPDEDSFDGSDFGSYLSDDESGERSGTLWDPYGYGDVTEAQAPVAKLALPAAIIGSSSGLVGAGSAADLEGEANLKMSAQVKQQRVHHHDDGEAAKPLRTAPVASLAHIESKAGGVGAAEPRGLASAPSPLSDRPLWDGAVSSPEGSSAEGSIAAIGAAHLGTGPPCPASLATKDRGDTPSHALGSDLHAFTLASLLSMLVSPKGGSLVPDFCPIFPLQGSRERAGEVLRHPASPTRIPHAPALISWTCLCCAMCAAARPRRGLQPNLCAAKPLGPLPTGHLRPHGIPTSSPAVLGAGLGSCAGPTGSSPCERHRGPVDHRSWAYGGAASPTVPRPATQTGA